MALGTVETIDPTNPQYGTVNETETGDSYRFDDPNFPKTGLKIGDVCTFDIQYGERVPIATNLLSYTPTERVINGPVDGPITSNAGETIIINKGGVVKGNIVLSSNSTLLIQDTGTVNGDVTVDQGSNAKVKKGGMVNGSIVVSDGSLLKVVNKGVVKGSIVFNSGNRLIIGNNTGGGIVTGSITTDRIRKLSITADSTINCGA